ncbi:hypothetical protein BD770DRAFT_406470 [Pilaira anomala]|nr:hypothetical protein BD770DRAFT_406470 [Pilaira anomala]
MFIRINREALNDINNVKVKAKSCNIGVKSLGRCEDNNKEKQTKYFKRIKMHLFKKYLFKPKAVKLYWEQYFIIKFWAYAFEEVFRNSCLALKCIECDHRCETIFKRSVMHLIEGPKGLPKRSEGRSFSS